MRGASLLWQKRSSLWGSGLACALVLLSTSLAHAVGSRSPRHGISVPMQLPLVPELRLPDPTVQAFGEDPFNFPASSARTGEETFLHGRYGVRSLHVVPDLEVTWPELPSLPGEEGPLCTPLFASEHDMGADPLPPCPLVSTAGNTWEKIASSLFPLRGGLASSDAVMPELLPGVTPRPVPSCWRSHAPLVRYTGELESLYLLECDGAASVDALERVSLLMRPAESEPQQESSLEDRLVGAAVSASSSEPLSGEWLPHLRLTPPRMLWLLEKLHDAFPRHFIVFMSGYRPGPHNGLHAEAKAIDLRIDGVPNEDVYRYCRTLTDVGCGFYPNNLFVHVDLRKRGAGHPYWIDISAPGKPSEYVDRWPGVEDGTVGTTTPEGG